MAIIVQYVVVREGKEKMTFTSKKEADAYDRMLDVAEKLEVFFHCAEASSDKTNIEQLAFYCANNKDELISLLKGNKLSGKPTEKAIATNKKLKSV